MKIVGNSTLCLNMNRLVEIVIFFTFFYSGLGLKNVKLTVEPNFVQRFQHCTLQCNYDLENATLYSVKWYRGIHEFYRNTPNEDIKTRIFPIAGITVDQNHSNSTQVVLKNIEFNLSGNFSCEVTTEKDFSTRVDTKVMRVIELPKDTPTISVFKEPLQEGDILKANCTSPPSRPPATLKFIINDFLLVAKTNVTSNQFSATTWSDLNLELPLKGVHFNDGRLSLRCIAEIGNVYQESAELRLDSSRDPIPERVTTSRCCLKQIDKLLIFLIFILIS